MYKISILLFQTITERCHLGNRDENIRMEAWGVSINHTCRRRQEDRSISDREVGHTHHHRYLTVLTINDLEAGMQVEEAASIRFP